MVYYDTWHKITKDQWKLIKEDKSVSFLSEGVTLRSCHNRLYLRAFCVVLTAVNWSHLRLVLHFSRDGESSSRTLLVLENKKSCSIHDVFLNQPEIWDHKTRKNDSRDDKRLMRPTKASPLQTPERQPWRNKEGLNCHTVWPSTAA